MLVRVHRRLKSRPINFHCRRAALLMQSAYCILRRRLNPPRRSGFGTLPWLRGSDADVAFPPRFLPFFIHSVTDISRVSESRKRDLCRSLRKKDSQGSFRSDCRARGYVSGIRPPRKPKFTGRVMEFRTRSFKLGSIASRHRARD